MAVDLRVIDDHDWSPPTGLENVAVWGDALLRESEGPARLRRRRTHRARRRRAPDRPRKRELQDLATPRLGNRADTWARAGSGDRWSHAGPRACSSSRPKRGRETSVAGSAPFAPGAAPTPRGSPRTSSSSTGPSLWFLGASESGRSARSTVTSSSRASESIDAQRAQALQRSAEDLAQVAASSLGTNLNVLTAAEDAPEGTFGLALFDTFRACLKGDENSSADAVRYNEAARELGRALRCPVVSSHHNGKGSDESTARSARGSGESRRVPTCS